jgi:hypothetical protein
VIAMAEDGMTAVALDENGVLMQFDPVRER